MCTGAGLYEGAAAEQYKRRSLYSINVIIARNESSVSSEAEAHAVLCLSVSKSNFNIV